MDSASDIPGSPMAWNGLLLTVPEDWEPSTIDLRYISLKFNNIAALDCKWTPESGPVSMTRKRKALEKQLQHSEGFTFAPDAIPAYWIQSIRALSSDFEALPFTHALGNGALCLHRPSNTTLLLQSYATSEETQTTLRTILASLGMTLPGAPTPYAMHDMQCTAPAGYTLKKAEFKPGRSALYFAQGKCTLTFQRLAPANVVLQGQPFRVWIQEHLAVPLTKIRKVKSELPSGAHKRYLWTTESRPSLLRRISLFRSRDAKNTQGTAWIVENENKLIVVTLASEESGGTGACSADIFDEAWRSASFQ